MELTKEYVDERFKQTDKRLDAIIENMVTKTDLEETLKNYADKNDVNRILTAVDGIAKQMTIYNQELPAITHQLQTITDWIKEASKKIGVEYRP
jgi:hypothetical protein